MMESISQDDDLELDNQLKLINKPPLKTIQTVFGHIVDCVDINKQLAFDNPLLKNHKIQLKPSFQHGRTTLDENQSSATLLIEEDLCPIGTVPIRRTTKDDLIRLKHLSNNNGMLTEEVEGSQFAAVNLNGADRYYGIKGNINTYNPTVASKEQMSGAYISLAKGPSQVYPKIQGDVQTYFFIAWENKQNQTGCYNLQCPGFVQIDNHFHIGSPITSTSTFGGQQFEMSVAILLDPTTNNWWVRLEDKNLGYFPSTIFSDMSYADKGGWYGRTMTTLGNPSPPMGSGHFPDDRFGHACFIRQMTFQNETRKDIPPEMKLVGIYKDNPSCYDVKYTGYVDKSLGYAMQFGGPGGNCGD
ncbi:hypothetical protein RIF29_06035 [Crotalaria pallida]|uniref:Neprosin PEP catalytic domain-containing protein n=1 Tax=Crotalaria pallida TaxID=3830 RepID=A0AAN9J2V4_CROPI